MRPGYERRGDWLVPERDAAEAEREFESWRPDRRARDRMSRAPMETDVDRWRENPRGLDYPGVDTPSAEPRESMMDARFSNNGGGAKLDPEEQEWRGSKLLGAMMTPGDEVGRVLDALEY